MGKQLTDDNVSECVGDALDQAMDLTIRFLADRADLSASAAFTMNRVSREGPVRLTTLAAKEGVSQPSMTQLVQRLERAGLVIRLADPDDGRACLVAITDEGREVLDERKRMRRERLSALMTTLTDDEQTQLWLAARVALPLICRLAANADCATDAATPRPGI